MLWPILQQYIVYNVNNVHRNCVLIYGCLWSFDVSDGITFQNNYLQKRTFVQSIWIEVGLYFPSRTITTIIRIQFSLAVLRFDKQHLYKSTKTEK